MADPTKCVPGECEDPKYPDPIKPKPMPANGGGGHVFVTELPTPDVAAPGTEYVLMDDLSDPSTYRGTFILNQETGAFISSSSGGGSQPIVVDNALSPTSTNPVQNKVITEELNKTVPVSRGGTGATSFEANKVLVGTGGSVIGTRSITGTIAENSSAIPTSDAVYQATKDKADKSEIPDVSNLATKQELTDGLAAKQPTLVSGTNIKTVNGNSLLGEGNIEIEGTGDSTFVAEYNVTTAQELMDYLDSTKEPFAPILVKRGNDYYTALLASKSSNSVTLRVLGSGSGDYIIFNYVVTGSNWASSSYIFQKKLVSGTDIKTINGQSLLGSGNIEVGGGTGTVDSALSTTSTNPVQNKVITTALEGKANISSTYNKLEVDNLLGGKADTTDIPDVSNLATKTEVADGLAAKQDTLTAGHGIDIDSNNRISATVQATEVYNADSTAADFKPIMTEYVKDGSTTYTKYRFYYRTSTLAAANATKTFDFSTLMADYTVKEWTNVSGFTDNGHKLSNGRTDNVGNVAILQQLGRSSKQLIVRSYGDLSTRTAILQLEFYGTKATISHTVSFDSVGGSTVPSQTVNDGDYANQPADPTKANSRFDFWADSNTPTVPFNFSTPITSDITLVAVWTPTFTVSFNTDGGSAVASQTVASGETATRPANPTKTGEQFVDWYEESTFTNVFNFNTPITADKTLYAKFEVVPTTNPDFYVGGIPNADGATVANFAAKTTQQLLDSVISEHSASDSPVKTETTFGTVGGTNMSIYYVMIKNGLEPISAVMESQGFVNPAWNTADIKNPNEWKAVHDDITINGDTYHIYGYRTRWNATGDFMTITVA